MLLNAEPKQDTTWYLSDTGIIYEKNSTIGRNLTGTIVGNNPVNFVDYWGYCGEKKDIWIHFAIIHGSIRIGDDWYHFSPKDAYDLSGPGLINQDAPPAPYSFVNWPIIPIHPDLAGNLETAIQNSIEKQPDYNVATNNCWTWIVEMVAEAFMKKYKTLSSCQCVSAYYR